MIAEAAQVAPLSPVEFLLRAAEAFPERPALIVSGRKTGWREIARDAQRLASALERAGIEEGDAVALLLPNGRALLVCLWGIVIAGGVAVALPHRLETEPLKALLVHSGAKLLVADLTHAQAASDLAPGFGGLVVLVGDGGATAGVALWDAFVASGEDSFAWKRPRDERAKLLAAYQPGPKPRAIAYDHRGAVLGAFAMIAGLNFQRYPRVLWTQPMTLAGGMGLPWALPALGGASLCLEKVTPGAIFEDAQTHGATHSFGSPALLSSLLKLARTARRSFRAPVTFLTQTAPTPSLVRDLAAVNVRVVQSWGPPEAHAPALLTDWHLEWEMLHEQDQAKMIAREGVRAPFLDRLRLRDPATGSEVPEDGDSEGEVVLSGELMARGYWNDAKGTAEAFPASGFRTGDLAVRHSDRSIEFKDQPHGAIAVGGTQVAFEELARILGRHPAVAAIVVEPGPENGAIAFVELRAGAQASATDLAAHCRAALDLPVDPCEVRIGPLPRSTTGRIARLDLRRQAGG